VASLIPQARLQQLRQTAVRTDDGVAWRVEYTYEDQPGVFEARATGSAMDVDAVMAAVDALLERIGRSERTFRLAPGRYNNGEIGVFVVADANRFPEVAWRLRLPLLRSPSVANLPAGVPTAAPEPLRVGARPMPPRPLSAVTAAVSEAAQDDVAVATGPGATAPMSLLESQFVTATPAPNGPVDRPADAAMKSLINGLRRSFGAGRLLQGGRWMKQVRAEPPAWLSASGDPVRIFYEKQETLFRKGRIGWGALVEADDGVFAPGGDDLPGVLVYSEDEHFDARPAELAAIGARLRELRNAGAAGGELARFAQAVRNDSGRPLGMTVPAALSAREPMLSSFIAIRAHLPDGVLAGGWFPVLIHPSSVVPMIMPSTFWPPAMLQAWNERRMVL